MMDLVLLKNELGKMFAIAPFNRVYRGDTVKVDQKDGYFEVVKSEIFLSESQYVQMIMESCGAGDVDEMPKVIGKWQNFGKEYEDEF